MDSRQRLSKDHEIHNKNLDKDSNKMKQAYYRIRQMNKTLKEIRQAY